MKRNKYHSTKTTVNGIKFDSAKEAQRWSELSIMQRAGLISNLQRQVKYELIPSQYEEVITYTPKRHQEKKKKVLLEQGISYIADFVYEKDGKTVVEDVKGYREGQAYALFKIKRKLMLYIHGIKVVEV